MSRKNVVLPTSFSGSVMPTVPKLDFPITPMENYRLLFEKRQPMWMPNNMLETQMAMVPNVLDRTKPMNIDGDDWWGVHWTFVPAVGAQVVAPDCRLLHDIENWKKEIQFPDLDAIDFAQGTEEMIAHFSPDKPVAVMMDHGCFERLHFLMGFEDTLLALMVSPEACAEFFDALIDWKIKLLKKLLAVLPRIDFMTWSDDYGTQNSTFFSRDTFKELFYGPLKRMVDFAHSEGIYFNLHSCGKVQTFTDFFADIGVDYWEAQKNNDFGFIKDYIGNRICVQSSPDPYVLNDPDATDEEIIQAVRNYVDEHAEGRNFMTALFPSSQRVMDLAVKEQFEYSMKVYSGK